VRLALTDLDIGQPSTRCAAFNVASVQLQHVGAGAMRLVAENLRVSSPGFDLAVTPAGAAIDDEVRIVRSRCAGFSQCWDFLRLSVGDRNDAPLPLGSRLTVEASNNLVQNVVLEGMSFSLGARFQAEDVARSSVVIRHNTLTSQGDSNFGIAVWLNQSLSMTIVNNAIAYIATPFLTRDPPSPVSSNLFSSDPSSKVWFSDFDAGNFVPSAGSPLVGAGAVAYGVATDIDGRLRRGRYDAGAFQR
jgi:hypothetical protein